MLLRQLVVVLAILILTFKTSYADEKDEDGAKFYSTSILALGELRQFENSYMDELNNYVRSLQRTVETLRKFIDSVKHKNLQSEANRIEFVSNPLNSIGLVRRHHEDWPKVMAYIQAQKNVQDNHLSEMHKLVNRTPNAEDMAEASLGMYRIEKFYNLESKDMAKGLVAGQQLE